MDRGVRPRKARVNERQAVIILVYDMVNDVRNTLSQRLLEPLN